MPVLATGRLTHPLAQGHPPDWASAWGQDRYGVFAEFTIPAEPPVTQRLRWIPPGRFLMGSPEDEPGRFEHEGPCHQVTIRSGFWLFDTPCTQSLWQAVMDGNPSRFVDERRPVERVSWDDCQEFLGRIREQIPGFALTLPAEAQWEYACRAGTTTATYAGPIEIVGDNNAPVLDEIAWYGGNSGLDFELEEGEDSSEWPEKQYPHRKAGTRQVGRKKPNPWGLYDMLGNVWEWCRDGWRDYSTEPLVDPVESEAEGPERVVRGGGWFNHARRARSAYRSPLARNVRLDFMGFRCALVQEPS